MCIRDSHQFSLNMKHGSRGARLERAIASKAIHRIFVAENWDSDYPFEQYMPQGAQDVPRLRGFKLAPAVAARAYFDASRKVLVQKSQKSDHELMDEICPQFVNPFVSYPKLYGQCSLAEKVVRQQHQHREIDIYWPTPEERIANMYILPKPAGMSIADWVKYCRAEQGGN